MSRSRVPIPEYEIGQTVEVSVDDIMIIGEIVDVYPNHADIHTYDVQLEDGQFLEQLPEHDLESA